jgi:hypothetical protein
MHYGSMNPVIDKETILKLVPMIIIGFIIAAYDYYIYSIWIHLYEKNYYCIGTSDGIGQICQFWFDLNPLPIFIFTAIGLLATCWHASNILNYIMPHQD